VVVIFVDFDFDFNDFDFLFLLPPVKLVELFELFELFESYSAEAGVVVEEELKNDIFGIFGNNPKCANNPQIAPIINEPKNMYNNILEAAFIFIYYILYKN